MSELQQEPLTKKNDVAGLTRTMSDLEEEILNQQAITKSELFYKDQVIENEMKTLNSTLAKELSGVRTDLADGLEYIRKLVEQQGHEVAELPNMRKEFADRFVSLFKLLQHNKPHGHSQTVNADIVDVHAVVEPSLETDGVEIKEADEDCAIADENSDGAALEVSLASDVNALMRRLEKANKKTVSYYKKKLRDQDQVIESMKNEVKALNESISFKDDCLGQMQEQLAKKQQEISNLTMQLKSQGVELCQASACIEKKNEEIVILENLLKVADKKLEERREQMKQMEKMACNVEQLTRIIADAIRNETSQKEVAFNVVEEMQTTLTSLTELRDHIKQISTRKVNEEPDVMERDLPDYLTRLQQLYSRMIEKLSAAPVAAELFQNDVLSLAQLQKVQLSQQTPVEAAMYLLDLILDARNKDWYDYFLEALKATNQGHIFVWLTYKDFNIDSQHSDFIRRNYCFLLEHLDPKGSELFNKLYEKKVIDMREKGDLEGDEGGAVRQSERLLLVLYRKSVEQFEQFLAALDETGHELVANELRRQRQSSAAVAENVSHHEVENAEIVESVKSVMRKLVALGDGIDENFYSLKSVTATITHVIAASEDRNGFVSGMTVNGDELFLARWKPLGHIEVYNASDFTFKRNITIAGERRRISGLTSCVTHNCLYAADSERYIVRVDLTDDNTDVRWKVKDDGKVQGLSITGQHNLLVTCGGLLQKSNKLIVYTTHGEWVREICLQVDVKRPQHAIELSYGEFLVSHRDRIDELQCHRVCVVDADGSVLRSFGNKADSESERSLFPKHLAVDRYGLVFVTDTSNNKILVMDRTLTLIRDLKIDNSGSFYNKMIKKVLQIGDSHVDKRIIRPFSLYLDENRNHLFVSELYANEGRVVIVKLAY